MAEAQQAHPAGGDPLRVRLDNGRLGDYGQDAAARGKRRGEWQRASPLPIRQSPLSGIRTNGCRGLNRPSFDSGLGLQSQRRLPLSRRATKKSGLATTANSYPRPSRCQPQYINQRPTVMKMTLPNYFGAGRPRDAIKPVLNWSTIIPKTIPASPTQMSRTFSKSRQAATGTRSLVATLRRSQA